MKTEAKPTPFAARSKTFRPQTGVENIGKIADGLAAALSDTYALIVKTHACHWNIVGPLFFSAHTLTETHYKEMFAAADVIAERIRALGRLAPSSPVSAAETGGDKPDASAREMIEGLVADHEALARRLHDLVEAAAEGGDPVTEDLATARSAFHEKAAWMLRAMIAD